MPARHIIISRAASKDLDLIWKYIAARASPTIAANVIREILDAVDLLADMPGIGHTRREVRNAAYRFGSVKSYVIGYSSDAQSLRVIRVVHGARNLGRFFR